MYTVIQNIIKYCEHGLPKVSKGMCKIKIVTNAMQFYCFHILILFQCLTTFGFNLQSGVVCQLSS